MFVVTHNKLMSKDRFEERGINWTWISPRTLRRHYEFKKEV